jgi:hypothetical protein
LSISGQRLVDGVVDHLIDQVVQAHLASRADVHGRTQTNRLQTFQDLDVFACIVVVVAVDRGTVRIFSRHKIPFAGLLL